MKKSITPTDEQYGAIKAIKKWFVDFNQYKKNTLNRFTLGGLAGTGKAQPLDSKIMTEKGYVFMRDISIGDKIFGEDGKLHNVVGVFPQGEKEVYEIQFSSGERVKCCKDHLWNYQTKYHRDFKMSFKTASLEEIMKVPLYIEKKSQKGANKAWNIYIPMTTPLQFKEQEVFIPPYIMGLFLGEGSFTKGTICFTNTEPDIVNCIKEFCFNNNLTTSSNGITYRIVDPEASRAKSNKFTQEIRDLGLFGLKSQYKFIPKKYLYNSIQNRMDLLSGLIDSDGEINGTGFVFSSTSLELTKNVQFLVESLGGTSTFAERQTYFKDRNGNKKAGLLSYRLHIKMPKHMQICKSEKHRNKYKTGQSEARRTIRNISYVGKEECQCIMTDNPTGLYLTDNCIVTHNTTIIPHILDELNLKESRVHFSAFTGKASMVLRKKGMGNATTIHKLIYIPKVGRNGKVYFIKNPDVPPYDLIVVDEASMISRKIQYDLESYGIPILYIGDFGQLPPVSNDMSNLMQTPDYRLETIHRQALENPIIWIANQARLGKWLKFGKYGDTVLKISKSKLNPEVLLRASQVLCGKNVTRHQLNQAMRKELGFDSIFPVVNDKLICLKNSYDLGLVNGMMGTCTGFFRSTNQLSFLNDDDYEWKNLDIDDEVFTKGKPAEYDKYIEQFDFSYTITTHKAQGSEFDSVIVYEEQLGDWANFNRWKYTAYTRASQHLVIAV